MLVLILGAEIFYQIKLFVGGKTSRLEFIESEGFSKSSQKLAFYFLGLILYTIWHFRKKATFWESSLHSVKRYRHDWVQLQSDMLEKIRVVEAEAETQ